MMAKRGSKKKVKMLVVGDFCTVVDSELAEHGIRKGYLIYVSGQSDMPMSEEDPYTLRRIFIAQHVSKDGHIFTDGDHKAFYIDPKRLKAVSKIRQEKFDAIKLIDFTPKEEEEEASVDEATD